jgi:hypothetical protein
LQEEKLSAANAEMSAELEHLHAEKHVRDAELIALRANITLLKDVLRDACPLACIEKLDAWMDKNNFNACVALHTSHRNAHAHEIP